MIRIGEALREDLTPDGPPMDLDPNVLTDHCLVLGTEGSGKTSLMVSLLRSVVADGRSALFFDTVGDMTERLGEAADVTAYGDGEAVRYGEETLRTVAFGVADAAELFNHPVAQSPEIRIEEAEDLSRALLRTLGYRSRGQTPELALMATALEWAWESGQDFRLEHLPALLIDPPFRSIGVFEIDSAISLTRRTDLANAIQGLIESADFVNDRVGEMLDVARLLRPEADTGAGNVISFEQTSIQARVFVVQTLLAKVHAYAAELWSGDDLELLLSFDEGAVFLPHGQRLDPSNPVRRALEGWARLGIGVILVAPELSHLNDLAEDHCQTWMVGRLPSPASRRPVVESLDLVDPPVDEIALDETIKQLPSGYFVARSPRFDTLGYFKTTT